MKTILVGDIGGTNIRYNLFNSTISEDILLKSTVYPFEEFKQYLIGSITKFLEGEPHPDIAVIGLPGIIKANRIIASSQCGPGLSGQEISDSVGIPNVILLNDLENSGYGILSLNPDEYSEINSAEINQNGVKVCISIGTGLGQCFIVTNNGSHTVYPTEGGYQSFSPSTAKEIQLHRYVCEMKNVAFISYCEVLSGPSINHIYRFLRKEYSNLVNPAFDAEFNENLKKGPKMIMQAGFTSEDKISKKVVKTWQQILGNLVGNAITNFLPCGGIYLFGGVVCQKYEDMIKGNYIKDSFYNSKNEILHSMMREIPIIIVRPDELGLRGGLFYARKKLFGLLS